MLSKIRRMCFLIFDSPKKKKKKEEEEKKPIYISLRPFWEAET